MTVIILDADNVCPICYDDYSNDTMVQTNCKHLFHRSCIEQWEKNTCPMCRSVTDYCYQHVTIIDPKIFHSPPSLTPLTKAQIDIMLTPKYTTSRRMKIRGGKQWYRKV